MYKTAHRASDEGGAACGVATKPLTFNFTVDLDDLEGCKLCWRSGCAPWVRRQTDAAGSEPDLPVSPSGAGSSDDDGFGDTNGIDLEGCKFCWRSGCAPWVRRQTDAAGSEPEIPESSSDDDGFGGAKDNLLDNGLDPDDL